MGIFDNIGRTISDAGQSTIKKTKEFADVTKLNSDIAGLERDENTAFYQMGKLYFSKHQTDPEDEFVPHINSIIDIEARIKDMRHQISVIKGIVICPKCGAENPVGSSFCVGCGSEIPREASPVGDNMTVCPSCHSVIQKGLRFCTSCGKPLDIPAAPAPVQQEAASAPVHQPAEQVSVQQPEVQAAEGQDVNQAEAGDVKKVCPKCGAQLDPDSLFCAVCGEKIQ